MDFESINVFFFSTNSIGIIFIMFHWINFNNLCVTERSVYLINNLETEGSIP